MQTREVQLIITCLHNHNNLNIGKLFESVNMNENSMNGQTRFNYLLSLFFQVDSDCFFIFKVVNDFNDVDELFISNVE